MGKNKRRTFSVHDEIHNKDLEVDSQEELEFVKWLNVACKSGIILDFIYQPPAFKLSEAASVVNSKGKMKSLFREHEYTADFILYVDIDKYPELGDELRNYDSIKSSPEKHRYAYFIDVKGGFMNNGSGRSFSINQKWVYAKYHIYVHKLVPKDFFKKFGIIEEFQFTAKTKKPSKRYEGFPLITEVFNQ